MSYQKLNCVQKFAPWAWIIVICWFCSPNLRAQSNDLLIQQVNIVDVINNSIQVGDVLIEDGRITQISGILAAPDGLTIVDGKGKFLIPGLIDAHIHLFQSGGIYTRPDVMDLRHLRDYNSERQWLLNEADDILRRYLACGITSVVDMGGPFYNFSIRDYVREQHDLPNLFMTGPLVSTYQPEEIKVNDPPIVKVNTSEEARELVRKQIPYDPDFIKIWYIVLPTQTAESTYDIVLATIDESKKHGLRVAVHATQLNTAKLAIKAGADVLVHSVRGSVDEDFIQMARDSDVVYIPTMVVGGNYTKAFARSSEITDADLQWAHPIPLGTLMDHEHMVEGNIFEQYLEYIPQMIQSQLAEDSIQSSNLDILNQEQLSIATGTDAGNIGTMHATSFMMSYKRCMRLACLIGLF